MFEVQSVFCHKCGTQATDDSVFCRKCGTRLIRDDTPQPPPDLGVVSGAAFSAPRLYNLQMLSFGRDRMAVIKMIKDTLGVDLRTAKELTDVIPSLILKDAPESEVWRVKSDLETVGAVMSVLYADTNQPI